MAPTGALTTSLFGIIIIGISAEVLKRNFQNIL
jgi:hypothetical protein